jgi:hypothetical protein
VPQENKSIDAKYQSADDGGPIITIYCNADAQREASQLAHECGHHLSFTTGWRTEAYRQANERMKNSARLSLADEEIEHILREECLAWRIGRMVVDACRVDLPGYESHWDEGLKRYCKHLGLGASFALKADIAAIAALYTTPAGKELLASLGASQHPVAAIELHPA